MAQAIGLKLYDQKRRKLLLEQLAAVKLICQNGKNFPVPVKGKGWLRAEVQVWAKVNLKLSKDKRTFAIQEIASRKDAKAPSQDLPPQAAPAGDDLFLNLTAEEIAEKNKRRLDYLQDIHLNPGARFSPTGGILKLTTTEVKELRAARPWLFVLADDGKPRGGQTDDGSDDLMGGQEGAAKYINLKYAGRITTSVTPSGVVNKMHISRWSSGKYLPANCKEFFPASHNSGRYSKAAINAWVEKFLVVQGEQSVLPGAASVELLDFDAELKKIRLEREREEFAVWQKSNSDKFWDAVTVLGFIGGFAHWLGLQQDKFIEDRTGVRKIVAECVTKIFQPTVEQLAALDVQMTAQLAAANSAMKTATAHRVTELVNDLTEQRKQEIQQAKEN